MNDVDNLKQVIALRLKQARTKLGHTQKSFFEEFGMPVASLKNYEGAKQIPGGEAIALFSCAGINANWLLTGEGPMLLADMVQQAPSGINVDALVHAIAAIFQVAPKGESVDSLARKAVAFYQYCESQGLITAEGQGEGVLKKTA